MRIVSFRTIAGRLAGACVVLIGLGQGMYAAQEGAVRAQDGLVALYDFAASQGSVVANAANTDRLWELRAPETARIIQDEGGWTLRGPTRIESPTAGRALAAAFRRTGAFTVEAWIRPAAVDQSGPARIVTLSRNGSERNLTLGQEEGRYDIRLRTTERSANGLPSVATPEGSVALDWSHLVYSRARSGQTVVYLDGIEVSRERVDGALTAWDGDYGLALGDEFSGGRAWLGAYRLLAFYNRPLDAAEVAAHFAAGPGGAAIAVSDQAQDPNATLFDEKVAAILSHHCLECHDTVNQKGDLDLSRRAGALAGSSSGEVLVPGSAQDSYLIESVETDEMPENRPPLSDEEKALLREWVDGGALYTVEVIDPSLFESGASDSHRWARRLTVEEYIETVRATLGVSIDDAAREILPADVRADGFSNTAYNLTVDLEHVQAFARLAEMIVARLDVGAFAARFSKSRRFTDNDNRALIESMGRWVVRGPLNDDEIAVYRGISTTVASAGGTFEQATGLVLEAMLQSPRFLYRVENQRGDGSMWPVGSFELINRMSYLIWGASPDEALFRLAQSGEILDEATMRSEIARMLKDPRARRRAEVFFSDWLGLGGLDNLRPNEERFPHWRPELAADMRAESLAFFREVVWEQARPLADILNAQLTYLTPRLARHYNLPVELEGADDVPQRVDLKSIPSRGGLLTQGSVLTVGGDEASMVARGLFVLHEALRGTVKDPPPCVDATPVPSKAGLTQRGIALERIGNPSCGGCHVKFEPLAFGLEKFDGLGSYHEADEHGNPLREDGSIVFPGEGEPVAYDSSRELMERLRESDRVRETLTWKLVQFGMGRPLSAADAPQVRAIHRQAEANGGTYAALVEALVLSDLVQMTQTEGLLSAVD